MRNKFLTLLFAIVASLGTLSAEIIERVQIGDLYYNLDTENKTAEVTSQNSKKPYWSSVITTADIPSSLEYNEQTYSVASIGDYAFRDCTSLRSIEIPDSIKSIGVGSFQGCIVMEKVTIGTGLISLGRSVFSSSENIKHVYWNAANYNQQKPAQDDNSFPFYASRNSIKTFVFGDSVKTIPAYLIKDYSQLDTIVFLPKTPPTIGENNFFNARQFIYVPCESIDLYKAVNELQPYADLIMSAPIMPYTIETIAVNGNIILPATQCDSTVIAVPDYGYHFVQWGDGNTDNPRMISITSDTTITAVFAPNKYKVSVVCDKTQGSIEGETGEFDYLTEKTYKAVPNYGYHFDYWQTPASDIPEDALTVSQATQLTLSLGINESTTETYKVYGYITSNYASYSNSYFMSDTPDGEGTFIIWRATNSALIGDFVIAEGYLKNYYNADYTISHPEMDAGGAITPINTTGNRNNPLTISITQDTTLKAFFAPNTYTISGNGTNGYISGTGSFKYLNECTIEAISDYGYHFAQWSDGVTDNPRTLVLTKDTTLTAEFAADTNGKCGDNLVWVLTDDVLTITGNGDMYNGQPWIASRDKIFVVNLPDGMTSIGDYAFYLCPMITALSVPSTVTQVGDFAFDYTNNIASFEGPIVAFDKLYSEKIQSLTLNSGALNDFSHLAPLSEVLTKLDLKAVNCSVLPKYALHDFYNLRELVLPDNLKYINYMAVAECIRLKSITIPASVIEIGDRAFEDCRSINALTFADGSLLQTIGSWAFYNCHNIPAIELPEGVTEIGDAAFYGCVYAENLKVPASVQSIGDNAFALCAKLSKMDVDALLPPAVEAKTFYEVSRKAPVYVPDESVNLYKNDPVWGELNIIGKSNVPQGIEITNEQSQITNKVIRNGQIYILRGEKVYTVTGQEVR